MLRQYIEWKVGHKLTNRQFKMVMRMTKQDIMFNNINFSKKTSLLELLEVAARCYKIVEKVESSCKRQLTTAS